MSGCPDICFPLSAIKCVLQALGDYSKGQSVGLAWAVAGMCDPPSQDLAPDLELLPSLDSAQGFSTLALLTFGAG